MSFFYVSSVIGERITGGGYATKQVGSYALLSAANVYESIAIAISDGASDGDVIVASDAHNYLSGITIAVSGGVISGLRIECAQDLNCDVPSTGALETANTAQSDLSFSGILSIDSVSFHSNDLVTFATSGSIISMNNLTLKILVINNDISISVDGIYVEFNDCIIDLNYNTNSFLVAGGSQLIINGGSVIGTASVLLNYLTDNGFYNGGGKVHAIGTDLSAISVAIIGNSGSHALGDDFMDVLIDNCKTHSSAVGINETLVSKDQVVSMVRSSPLATSAEYQRFVHSRGGALEDSTAFYRNDSQAFVKSLQKISYKCFTDTNANMVTPFQFTLPSKYAELSVATTDKIRVFLLCATALTDADVTVKASIVDTSDNAVLKSIHSVANHQSQVRTPTALTASADAWTGRTTENLYQIDIDTAGLGADCVPEILVSVSIPATPIYFCSTVETVA